MISEVGDQRPGNPPSETMQKALKNKAIWTKQESANNKRIRAKIRPKSIGEKKGSAKSEVGDQKPENPPSQTMQNALQNKGI